MKKTYKIKSLPQTKKSNLIKVNFKKGGSIPKYQTGTPTYADSLALYNNALAKDAYYRNQKDYKLLQTYLQSESPFTEENLKYAADHTRYEREYIENYMLEDPEVFPELTKDHLLDRIKKISNTLYSTSDFLGLDESNGTLGGYDYIYDPNLKPTKLSAHDHRTNPDAPPILYSPYILPQGALHYSHNDIYDLSMVPYYDPVMVKPWNMLTKKEKEFRRKVEKEGYVFTNPYPEDNSTGTTDPNISVDVRFRKLGLDSSFSNRKKVAEQAGIENYKGTAEQNKALNEWIVENYNPETKTFKTENIDSLPIDSLPIKRQTQLTNIQPQLTNKSTKDSEPQERTKQVPKYFWEQLPNGTWVKRKFIDVGKTDTFEFQKGGIKVNFQKGGSIPKYQKGNQKYNIQKPKPIGYYQNTLDPEVSESTAVENIFRPTEEQITKDREHIKRVGDLTKAIKEETGVSHNQAVQNAQMIIENEMKGQPSMQAMPTRLQGKAQEEFSKKVMDDSWTLSDYMALPLDLMSTFSPPSDETRYQRRFRRYNPNTSALDKLKESTSEALSLAPSAALNVGLTLAAMPGASASTIAAESMLPFSTSLQKAALNLEPIPAFVKSLPIRRAANYTPGLVRYVDDVIGTTKMKGKFSLPKYQNTYRIEHPDVNMTSTADDVTGRWFLKTPNTNDTGFYLENLKDPTGKVIKNPPGAVYGFSSLENPSKVRIMTQRLPEYKINQQFGAGMPEEARIMSMGRGDMTNAQLDEVIGAGAGDRFTEGKFLWTDYNAMETAPFLYHPSEGILNASQVNKLRTGNTGILSGGKSQVFDNQAEAFKYFLNESEAAKNVFSKFRQRLPFQEGGSVNDYKYGGSIPKFNFKKGYRRVYEEDSGSTEFGKKKVIDVYRPMFGTSKTVEKDITYAFDDEPRKKFTEREVTKTFNDGSLKSYKMIRRKDGKLLKEYSTPKQTFEKGEMPHNLIQKIGYPKIF